MIQCMREHDVPFYLQNAKVMAIGVCKMMLNIVKTSDTYRIQKLCIKDVKVKFHKYICSKRVNQLMIRHFERVKSSI